MKKSIIIILVCLATFCMSEAQNIVEDNFQRLQVSFSVSELRMEKVEMDGREFTQLSVEGMQPSSQVGAPNLPTWSAIIEVPVCNGFEVEVTGVEYGTIPLSDAVVSPVQPSRSKSDIGVHPLSMDEKIYGTDESGNNSGIAI